MKIVSNDPDESPYLISLTGTAAEAGATINPRSLDTARVAASGGLIDPELDSDGDRLPDLLELAVGSNPRVFSPSPLTVESADGKLIARYPRDKEVMARGVKLRIEWSADFLDWRSDQVVEIVESENSELQFMRSELPSNGAPHKFVRLRLIENR